MDRSGITLKGSARAPRGLIWHSKGTEARFCKFNVIADLELKESVFVMKAVCLPIKAFVAVYGPKIICRLI